MSSEELTIERDSKQVLTVHLWSIEELLKYKVGIIEPVKEIYFNNAIADYGKSWNSEGTNENCEFIR